MPTLLGITGVAVPAGLDGRSLVPVLKGERDRHRESLLFAYRDVQRAVRDDRWKLIEYDVKGARTTQLFDLADDPWETRNLAAEPAPSERLAALRRELSRLQKEWGDPRSK